MRKIDRLDKYLKYKGLNDNKITIQLGLTVGIIGKSRKEGRDLSDKTIEQILNYYTDLNNVWLLTGEGEMLKTTTPKSPIINSEESNYMLVPLCNMDAVGGINTCPDVIDSAEYIDKYIPFTDARKGDICMPVSGNSMVPIYPPGSIVLLREVESWREYFGFGNIFVLFLNDGRRLLKEVQKGIDEPKDNILCVSYNERNPPEELPRKLILKVYKVIKSLNNEGF